MQQLKVVFAGPMGAGKSTAINALSDIKTVATEARNNERSKCDKATTTVAMDYGEISLGDAGKVALYGVPGQKRFSFMWPILVKGAMGIIVLIDCSQPNYLTELQDCVDTFSQWVSQENFVVALNRCDEEQIDACHQLLEEKDLVMPVFISDPRSREDLTMLLHVLISNAELSLTMD